MQWTEYTDMTVTLYLHVPSASFGTSFSLRNQTHLFVRLIDHRTQDWLASSDVAQRKTLTKLIACPHLQGGDISGNNTNPEQGDHIRVDVSNAVDGMSQSSNDDDRARIPLLTDASDTYFDTVGGVGRKSYTRVCSCGGLFDSCLRGGWEISSLTGVAFIWARGDSLEGVR